MNEDPVLRRIDRTLDRIDAGLRQSERAQAERETRWEQDRAEREVRWEEQRAESRRYQDALLDRHALVTADQIAALQAMREQDAADSAALQAEIADQRSQIRAQTEALLKVLDRLPPERPQG